ncbi:hypothetical protein ABI_19080 [Asticcacaulis biprosthecium C19]|uniref:Uncharacterized protein n=1 Tax=Asticcacaulis biprosthecium C19 TaxID=715226 RepID=F4QL93_9CAUL|nr:hypothetical protein ABI_19080 [Asticcacaulis biprosthecium C19]
MADFPSKSNKREQKTEFLRKPSLWQSFAVAFTLLRRDIIATLAL